MATLEIVRGADEASASAVASWSSRALDAPLACAGRLWVAAIADEATLVGAFQRATSELRAAWAGPGVPGAVFRRVSGGPAVRVGPRTLYVALALARPDALAAANERQIVNRAVRPLLRGLTRAGYAAAFFGRDWVSVARRPAAWVGFAHDAATRRTIVESFVAIEHPFAPLIRPAPDALGGKVPGTLEGIAGRPVDVASVAGAIVDAYAEGHDVAEVAAGPWPAAALVPVEPPWEAAADEAIGVIGAGRDAFGVFRVGGDLLVSRDALARLEASVRDAPADEDLDAVGRRVDAVLGAPGVALEGVRSLATVRDVIARARAAAEA